jgi:hypothetical protein
VKVKIGHTIYDADKEPIMIILNDKDKENLKLMQEDATRYCAYPDSDEWTSEKVTEWMES